MRTPAIVACALTTALTVTSVDLTACGDKFVRVGRSARLGGYASIHPASILVYQPMKPSAKGAREFEAMLTRAGHVVTFVPNGSDIARVAGAAKYDLIVANYVDVSTVTDKLRSMPAPPSIVPMIGRKPEKSVEAQAKKDFHCILAPYRMNPFEALEELDHAMAMRLKAQSAGAIKK